MRRPLTSDVDTYSTRRGLPHRHVAKADHPAEWLAVPARVGPTARAGFTPIATSAERPTAIGRARPGPGGSAVCGRVRASVPGYAFDQRLYRRLACSLDTTSRLRTPPTRRPHSAAGGARAGLSRRRPRAPEAPPGPLRSTRLGARLCIIPGGPRRAGARPAGCFASPVRLLPAVATVAAQQLHPETLRLDKPPRIAAIGAAFEDPSTALAWLDAERAKLMAAVPQAAGYKEHATVYRLADAPMRLLSIGLGMWRSWL